MATYSGGVLKFLVVVILFAVIVYLTVKAIERRGVAPQPKRPPARPVAPDDDPEFLRDLERKRKHPEDPEPS